MKSELVIGFLTSADPNDRRSWSGTHFQMLRSLENQFVKVIPLGPVEQNRYIKKALSLLNKASLKFFSRSYNISHNILLSKYYGHAFNKKLKGEKIDVIFSPVSSTEIAFLNTKIPICYFGDTSFSQIKDYYQFFSNILKLSETESNFIQRKALKNSAIIVHSSKWATDYVIEHYGVAKNKTFTVALGANIDEAPAMKTLELKINDKATCNLLFIGVDWERKGGAIAFETLRALNEMGLDTRLTVCGCTPPEKYKDEKMTVVPFLDKNIKEQYQQFLELLYHAHFLILPTRAECTAIVYAEASAYGIPSITTDTGGIAAMVENDANGYRLSLAATGPDYAQLIKNVFTDDEKYKKLVYSSRAKYDNEINWQAWGALIKEIILSHYHPSK